MASGVVTVGRHRYAVGLYWENSPGGGRVAQIAKEAAKQPGQQADFFTVRPGNRDGRVPQFGLCTREMGQKPGMPVLAACLAQQLPGSWAGAFRTPEGIALTIVRDDLIVPDGDLFYTEETEARDRLIQEVGFGGLQTIYAPEAWSIPGADTIPLTLLLNDQTEIQLQRVSIPTRFKIAAAGVLALAGLIAAGIWYQQLRMEEQQRVFAQQQEALRRAQQAGTLPGFGQKPPPEPKYERHWESAPPVMDVLNNCRSALAQIPAAISGWSMTGLTCSGSNVALAWNRTIGQTEPPLGAPVNETASTASKNIILQALSPRGSQDLLGIDDITNRYLLQVWSGTIARAPDDPPPPPPPDYKGPWNPPPPPWVKRSFTLTVPELPGMLPVWLGDLPGTVINTMRYTPGGGWSVEGVIYENRR